MNRNLNKLTIKKVISLIFVIILLTPLICPLRTNNSIRTNNNKSFINNDNESNLKLSGYTQETTIVRPNGDITTQWSVTPSGSHYSTVDEETYSESDEIRTDYNNQIDSFTFTTVDLSGYDSGEIYRIECVFACCKPVGANAYIDITGNHAELPTINQNMYNSQGNGVGWNVTTFTQTDLNNLQITIKSTNIAQHLRVVQMYCTIYFYGDLINAFNKIFFENKTYTQPSSGYYPASYGFENDKIGNIPRGWSPFGSENCFNTVVGEIDSHKNVLQLYDNNNTNMCKLNNTFLPKTSGTIEFYWRGGTGHSFTCVYNGPILVIWCAYDWDQGDFRTYYNSQYQHVMDMDPNQWYHHKYVFDCSTHTFDWYIDGVLMVNDKGFWNNENQVDRLYVGSGQAPNNYYTYYDAIGYSWDPKYNVGDNTKEGLLLSFENSTNLDWIGYSLDGAANKTILGNATIPIPANDVHTIQLFCNDTSGNYYNSEIIHFTVNIGQVPSTPSAPGGDDDDEGNGTTPDDFSIFLIILVVIVVALVVTFSYVLYRYHTKQPKLEKKKVPKPKKEKKPKPPKQKKKEAPKAGVIEGNIPCPYCFNENPSNAEYCSYCGVSLKGDKESEETKIQTHEEIHETPIVRSEAYYQAIFLQSSSILKIWIYDLKNNSKIYEETLNPEFSNVDPEYIDILKIVNTKYKKNIFVETPLEYKNQTLYLYAYSLGNPLIFIYLANRKNDENYFEFLEKAIHELERHYAKLKEEPSKIKEILDDNILLFNSRKFNQISTFKKDVIFKIFQNKDDIDSILKEIPTVPIGTLKEFLDLYERLTEELKFAITKEAIDNTSYFEEGGR